MTTLPNPPGGASETLISTDNVGALVGYTFVASATDADDSCGPPLKDHMHI